MSKLLHPVPSGAPTDGFGYRGSVAGLPAGLHNGQDWSAPAGTPVRAPVAGVARRGWEAGGFGNYVVINVGTTEIFLAHLSRFAVEPDARVQAGQLIGWVGSTGAATGPHLHLSVRVNGTWVDPMPLIVASNEATETHGEDEEVNYINIKGRAGARRGGAYIVIGRQAFFAGSFVKDLPVVSDEATIQAMQKLISGLS